jgi:hypothetical protein
VAPGVFLVIRTDQPALREAMVLREYVATALLQPSSALSPVQH